MSIIAGFLFFQAPKEDGADKEKKCNEVPECFKCSLSQLFAVRTLHFKSVITVCSLLLLWVRATHG